MFCYSRSGVYSFLAKDFAGKCPNLDTNECEINGEFWHVLGDLEWVTTVPVR